MRSTAKYRCEEDAANASTAAAGDVGPKNKEGIALLKFFELADQTTTAARAISDKAATLRAAASPALWFRLRLFLRGGGVWSGRMPDIPRGASMAVLADFIDVKRSRYRYKPYDRVFVPPVLSDTLAEFRIFATVDFEKIVFVISSFLNFQNSDIEKFEVRKNELCDERNMESAQPLWQQKRGRNQAAMHAKYLEDAERTAQHTTTAERQACRGRRAGRR
jgi:hypothetical protein